MIQPISQEKYPALKKQLIRTGIVCAVVLGGLLALMALLMQIGSSAMENKTALDAKLQAINADIGQHRTQYTQATQSLALYDKLHAQGNPVTQELNRDNARTIFDSLKKRYHFSVLKITMSPIQGIKDDAYTPKEGSLVSSDVDMGFEGVTDEEVVTLIQDLRRELPGYVRMKSLSIAKKPAEGDPLRQLAQGTLPVLVQGDVKFQWLGVTFDKSAAPAPEGKNP